MGKIIGAHWALGARRQGPAVAVAIASESEHGVLKKKPPISNERQRHNLTEDSMTEEVSAKCNDWVLEGMLQRQTQLFARK